MLKNQAPKNRHLPKQMLEAAIYSLIYNNIEYDYL